MRLSNDASYLKSWSAYIAAFLGLAVFYLLAADRRVGVYDEGLVLTDALRVMHGLVPHRDFYYNYGPGKIYLLAGIFKVFGLSVYASRIFSASAGAFLILTVFAVVKRFTSTWAGIICAALAIVWPLWAPWSLLIALMLWTTALLSEAQKTPLIFAGILAGIATLLRYDMGGVGMIACHLLTLAFIRRSVLPYLGGCALILVPVSAFYVRDHVVRDFVFDIFVYTDKHYRAARALPFPGKYSLSANFVAYLVPIVLCIALYTILRNRKLTPLLPFTLLAAMTYAKGLVRIDPPHLMPAVVTSIVVLGLLYKSIPWSNIVAGFFLMFAVAACIPLIYQRQKHATPPQAGWCTDRNPITRDRCYTLDADHIRVVEFLEAHSHPNDTLYVGLPDHDRIYINDNVTYFATRLLPATKWSQFDPFLQNSAPIQREMIADLDRNQPPYVVLDSEFDHDSEPNGSSMHTGVHLLDDYIRARYIRVQSYGGMTILRRH